MSTKPTIEELLALRDGEALPADRARELEADERVRETLHALRDIRHELESLPDVTPGADVWANVRDAARARQDGQPSGAPGGDGWLSRFPMAAAASVFFAAVIGMLVWQPFETPVEQSGVALGDLVNRSKLLEAQVGLPVTNAPTASETALFYRLADIDAELMELDTRRASTGLSQEDERWRRALWQRRVSLLESLRTVQRAEQPEFTYAVY